MITTNKMRTQEVGLTEKLLLQRSILIVDNMQGREGIKKDHGSWLKKEKGRWGGSVFSYLC